MKKLLLLSAAALLSAGAMAQSRIAAPSATAPQNVFKPKAGFETSLKERATESRWLNYSDQIEFYIQGGGAFPDPAIRSSSLMPIFPDTTIILGIDGTTGLPFGNWIHAAGTMIEPVSMPNVGLDPNWIVPGNPYHLDSTALIYSYVRRLAPSVVDTLVLTFIKHNDANLYTIDPTGEAWEYQDILWDTVTNRVKASEVLSEVTYALTEADSTTYDGTSFSLKELGFSTPMPTVDGERIGVVVTFRPGFTWVPFVGGNPAADSLLGVNSFWLLSFEENGDNTDPINYGYQHNMSYVIDSRSLYAQWDDIGWNGFLLPTPFWATGWPWENHAIYFKVTSEFVSVENIANNFASLALYPNPAADGVTVGVNLESAANDLTLVLTDVLGREVMNVNGGNRAAGKHNMSISTSNLSNGVYNCTVKSGANAVSTKVVVAH